VQSSRTIKRDGNSGMDETKCLKVYSKTKIIPATNDPLASCLSLENIFPRTSELFSEVLGCSPVRLLKSPVPRGSRI
jgi:hypothetical protein